MWFLYALPFLNISTSVFEMEVLTEKVRRTW